MADYGDEKTYDGDTSWYPEHVGKTGSSSHPSPAHSGGHHQGVANPTPLGFMGFALTTFILSCYNAAIFGVKVTTPPNVITGMALFYGGFAQLLAGMWEMKAGNTVGATTFTSYGAFWLSYAATLIPSFGINQGYLGHEKDLAPAVAIYLLSWTLFTFMMWVATLKENIAVSSLFASLTLTFILITIAEYRGVDGYPVKRAGGFFGIFTSIIAWYLALSGLLTHNNSYLVLPLGNLNKRH